MDGFFVIDLQHVLEKNKVWFSQMLESGYRLKETGCMGVDQSTWKLQARWESVQKKLEHEQTSWDRKKKLRARFLQESAVLTDWMAKATELVWKWSQIDISVVQMDVQQRCDYYLQAVDLSKDLEAKSKMRVTVIGTANQLVHLEAGDNLNRYENHLTAESQNLHQGLHSINTLLRQMELDWSNLHVNVPNIQKSLHK
ncbi:hypothetical protein CHARACLAT_030715, partial [Characodon lateralis]|nr:hypothetical protein [Characodon lateralis]